MTSNEKKDECRVISETLDEHGSRHVRGTTFEAAWCREAMEQTTKARWAGRRKARAQISCNLQRYKCRCGKLKKKKMQYLCETRSVLTEVNEWIRKGGRATSAITPNADIMREVLCTLRSRTEAGRQRGPGGCAP